MYIISIYKGLPTKITPLYGPGLFKESIFCWKKDRSLGWWFHPQVQISCGCDGVNCQYRWGSSGVEDPKPGGGSELFFVL